MLTGLSYDENNTKDVDMMLLPKKEKLKFEQIYCNSPKGGSKEKYNDVFDDHVSSSAISAISSIMLSLIMQSTNSWVCRTAAWKSVSVSFEVFFHRIHIFFGDVELP